MTKPINFGVIGCGMLARSMHIPNIARSEKTVLHTCCDLSDEALSECQQKHGALHISKDYKAVIAHCENYGDSAPAEETEDLSSLF